MDEKLVLIGERYTKSYRMAHAQGYQQQGSLHNKILRLAQTNPTYAMAYHTQSYKQGWVHNKILNKACSQTKGKGYLLAGAL